VVEPVVQPVDLPQLLARGVVGLELLDLGLLVVERLRALGWLAFFFKEIEDLLEIIGSDSLSPISFAEKVLFFLSSIHFLFKFSEVLFDN